MSNVNRRPCGKQQKTTASGHALLPAYAAEFAHVAPHFQFSIIQCA